MIKLLVICMALTLSALACNHIIAAEHPASSEKMMMQQKEEPGLTGEELFKRNCAVCHPDGGNIINPQKELHKEDRDEFGIKNAEDIIKLMRNPGPGMRIFDANTLPDRDAIKIAEYVLKTF